MSDTMLERVADALAKAEGMGGDPERTRKVYMPLARVAIEAMREPTNEAKVAISSIAGPSAVAWWIAGHYTMIDVALSEAQSTGEKK
jgi:hypothetical protein